MTLLANLSVGRKLALAAILPLLLLGGMIAVVWNALGQIEENFAQEVTADQVSSRLIHIEVVVNEARVHLRDVINADMPRDLDRAEGLGAQAMAKAENLAREALRDATSPAVQAALRDGLERFREYGEVRQRVIAERRQLLATRDRFFATGREYERRFELAAGEMEFAPASPERDERRQRLLALNRAATDIRIALLEELSMADEARRRRVISAAQQMRVYLRPLANLPPNPVDLRPLTAQAEQMAVLAEGVLASLDAIEMLRRTGVVPNRERMEAALEAAASAMEIEEQTTVARLNASLEMARMAMPLVSAVMAALLIGLGLMNARAIGRPLNALSAMVAALARGEVTEKIAGEGRRDEIGIIAGALRSLQATVTRAFAQGQMLEQVPLGVMVCEPGGALRITYANATSKAELARMEKALACKVAELEGQSIDVLNDPRNPQPLRALLADPARLPYAGQIRLGEEVLSLRATAIRDARGQYLGPMLSWSVVTAQARLAESFEAEVGAVVAAVARSATELQESARGMSGSARRSGEEATAVASASEQAGSSVQAVAASAEELAASVAEVTRQVQSGATVARDAAEETRRADATIRSLSEAAERIGEVVELISNIAGQTNLLALNATIEAARAGEAGKGFAVVASEVKNLASQTAKATEEISSQIQSIQGSTAQAVAALRGIGATVERMNQVTATIAAAVEEQSAATQEIARSAAQVSDGTQAVSRRIGDVSAAASETGQAAASVLEAAGGLSGQAAALRSKADEFLRSVRAA
ncbi:methyl-accepting chemotaxis protein [Roseomonas sp. GC11]|uniref:methyl-accepting chemotaxis protein n=1 Tax=Roseomonas sp. GC11 TaxID=2950546 RepID=UPI00210E645E|nr:methyl-accepting chemotaxis protein [Roseomonas sp. GC11]MCQ4158325.1 methyl-accepting chemotaxis protein [Roseomonas sp. GC11]